MFCGVCVPRMFFLHSCDRASKCLLERLCLPVYKSICMYSLFAHIEVLYSCGMACQRLRGLQRVSFVLLVVVVCCCASLGVALMKFSY